MKLNVNGIARAALGAGVLAASLLLASCGGGTQSQTFRAGRVIAFGDEFSVINDDGSKYSVNALVAGSTTLDCTGNLIWIQTVANAYGLVFPQCRGTVDDPASRIYASAGATVADLSAQIDQQLFNNGGFVATDLVTVLVGANDVAAQFALYPNVSETELLVNVTSAGLALADQVNRIASFGAKVLISTIPDMGLTPFAGDRSAGSTDGNPALLTRLSNRFNDALLSRITNDGHKVGLIQLDQFLQATDKAALLGQGSFANSTQAACAAALPRCTTNTLVAEAVNATWLWADGRHFGPSAQLNLGSLAVNRAQNNPF